MTVFSSPARPAYAPTAPVNAPSIGVLLRMKFTLLRNRIKQLIDQSPLQLILILVFVATIWGGLYLIFDHVLIYIRKFEEQAIIALPIVFNLFFFSMTILLAFSTAILMYSALFGREESAFLMASPAPTRNVVAVLYLESLFFSSWSLVLLGLPLMAAIGHVQGLPWHFYPIFLAAFLFFVPIPGAIGLLAALFVAMYMPRNAKKTALWVGCIGLLAGILWWGRLWTVTSNNLSNQFIDGILNELGFLKAAILPSAWVSRSIQLSIADQPWDAAFYLLVTGSTAAFLSWWGHVIVAAKLLPAFGRAHSAPTRARPRSAPLSAAITRVAFFYLPAKMRCLILKDVRNFLRDPMQWSQLLILFGLLSMYLFYLPRSRPEGFDTNWRSLICFLNFGAITLILSTFTSRFVFPMMSLEGQQIWLVALWPLPRSSVVWAKFFFALTVTAGTALPVTLLSIRSLSLTPLLAIIQASCTFAACAGLCGLAIGLGAIMPNYSEPSASRISSGFGGTVNLIASVLLVVASVALFAYVCFDMAVSGHLNSLTNSSLAAVAGLIGLNGAAFTISMLMGEKRFQQAQF